MMRKSPEAQTFSARAAANENEIAQLIHESEHQPSFIGWQCNETSAHLKQVKIPRPEPLNDFQKLQPQALYQHLPNQPKLKRGSESAPFKNSRRVTTGEIEVYPVLMRLKGKRFFALPGIHNYVTFCSRVQEFIRSKHIEDGGATSTTPYWMPNVSGAEYDYVNSPIPIMEIRMPPIQIEGARTTRHESDEHLISCGSLEFLREHISYIRNNTSQLLHGNDGMCNALNLFKLGNIRTEKLIEDVCRRTDNNRVMLMALVQSVTACFDLVLTEIRKGLTDKCSQERQKAILMEPSTDARAIFYGNGSKPAGGLLQIVYEASKQSQLNCATAAFAPTKAVEQHKKNAKSKNQSDIDALEEAIEKNINNLAMRVVDKLTSTIGLHDPLTMNERRVILLTIINDMKKGNYDSPVGNYALIPKIPEGVFGGRGSEANQDDVLACYVKADESQNEKLDDSFGEQSEASEPKAELHNKSVNTTQDSEYVEYEYEADETDTSGKQNNF